MDNGGWATKKQYHTVIHQTSGLPAEDAHLARVGNRLAMITDTESRTENNPSRHYLNDTKRGKCEDIWHINLNILNKP